MNIGQNIAAIIATAVIAPYIAYCLHPTMHDLNSTRALLKKESLDKYFIKEQEYIKLVKKIGDMARYPDEATPSIIAHQLDELRNSPFYDDIRCKTAYKNLRILQIEKKDSIPISRLHKSPNWCIPSTSLCFGKGKLSCHEKDGEGVCTKEELLRALYVTLANNE